MNHEIFTLGLPLLINRNCLDAVVGVMLWWLYFQPIQCFLGGKEYLFDGSSVCQSINNLVDFCYLWHALSLTGPAPASYQDTGAGVNATGGSS